MDTDPTVVAEGHGYARSVVDDFVAAAELEREHLRGVIASANRREEEARAAFATHELMLAMLLEAQRELSARRRSAEVAAEAMLDDAEREARAILAAARPSEPTSTSLSSAAPTGGPTIDLAEFEAADDFDRTTVDWSEARNGQVAMVGGIDQRAARSIGGEDGYFEFLRGALVDDEPLGPRPE